MGQCGLGNVIKRRAINKLCNKPLRNNWLQRDLNRIMMAFGNTMKDMYLHISEIMKQSNSYNRCTEPANLERNVYIYIRVHIYIWTYIFERYFFIFLKYYICNSKKIFKEFGHRKTTIGNGNPIPEFNQPLSRIQPTPFPSSYYLR